MLRRALCGILAIVWLFPSVVFAAERWPIGLRVFLGKWWRMPHMEEELKLTGDEKDKLDDLFLNYRRKLIDLKSVERREWLEVDNLLGKEQLNEAAITDHFERAKAARSDLSTQSFRFLLEVRKILGAERYERLKGSLAEWRKERRRKRFGKRPEGHLWPQKPLSEG